MTNNISTRGRTFTGTVTSDKMSKTVTVEWTRRHFIQKYERYSKRKTKIKAHNPDEMDARVGDKVTVMETKPMSKTKHFIIIKKHGAEEAEKEEKKPAKKTVKKTTKKATKKTEAKETTPVKEAENISEQEAEKTEEKSE